MSPQEAGETTVADLVAQCLSLVEEGTENLPYDDICSEHPHLQSDVMEGVRVALELPDIHMSGPGVDALVRSILADRYQLKERIGSGAMGVVYSALDLDLGRPVAIKVMQTGLIQRSTALARFEREAAALAAVKHEAVVTIYDRGVTEDGTSYLVMELVEGVPCSKILDMARERGGLDDESGWLRESCGIVELQESSFLRQVMRWTADVASGLAAVHAAGVVHRDVKPSNIIIRPNGTAVLLDFGIAAKDDQATLTATGAAVGTPAYMAPESLMGKGQAQPSQDVYGLAATLYHMLTLEAPYRGGAHEVLAAIAMREPTPAVKVRPGLPRDAQAILDHGLARDPSSRYGSLAAMENDLRALLAYRPVGVRPTSTLARMLRRARRSKMVMGAAIATGLIIAGTAANHWRQAIIAQPAAAWATWWPTVIANFAINDLPNRVYHAEEAVARMRETFDELVSSGHDAVTAYNMRAAFRLDHGDLSGAKEDMRAVAAAAGSAFAQELARRHDSLPDGTRLATKVNLEGLPEPKTADDNYLAAWQLIRHLQYLAAAPYLRDERLKDHRHSQELLLILDSFPLSALKKAGKTVERDSLVKHLNSRADEIRQRDGYDGATLWHITAMASLRQGRFIECALKADSALALAPTSHVALDNASYASYHAGDIEGGLALVQRARKLLPKYWRLRRTHALLENARGRYDEARAILTSGSFPKDSIRAQILFRITGDELLAERERDGENTEEIKQRALQAIGSLAPSIREVNRATIETIASGETRPLFYAYLADVTENPFSAMDVQRLLRFMPDDLTEEETTAVRQYLEVFQKEFESRETSGSD